VAHRVSLPADHPLLVLLLGPTASGKTALSLDLAGHFHGEIVSCDSVAVYRDCEIGAAKPTPAERAQIPHHLIDVFSPAETCSAGHYSRLARQAIADIRSRNHLPIVTGGTGFYLRALTDGLFPAPPRSTELRVRLHRSATRQDPGWLHRILNRLDPAAAARIHANDQPKLIRAIEVCLAARQPITTAWAAGRDPLTGYRILRIGLNPPRTELYDRINTRAAAMFAHGLVEETQSLIARYGASIPVLDALGYRQARQLLSNELTREQAIAAAQQGHRNYAKRQLTWFRREPHVHWLATFGDQPQTLATASNLISEALVNPSAAAPGALSGDSSQ
jgi:tRNA dimethylallyltransferase